jgi:hypothetical protein
MWRCGTRRIEQQGNRIWLRASRNGLPPLEKERDGEGFKLGKLPPPGRFATDLPFQSPFRGRYPEQAARPYAVAPYRQEAFMRLIALGAASAIASVLTLCAEAADLAYPSAGHPQLGGVPPPVIVSQPPAVMPPQVVVVSPANGALVPPAVVGPYGAYSGVAPGNSLPPGASCDRAWGCGHSGCPGPICVPHSGDYARRYGAAGPPVYSQPASIPESYAGRNGGAPLYSGRASETYSRPYPPQIYSGPAGRMRWMVGPQPHSL